jgi:hypothetical protein
MNTDEDEYIKTIFHRIASARGFRLGYNTHYDAYNYVFSWWQGDIHHRLDFQPMNGSLVVTHLTDRYKFLPHVFYWLYGAIPEVFRFPPTVEFTRMGIIKLDNEKAIEENVGELLNTAYNNGLQRIAAGSR